MADDLRAGIEALIEEWADDGGPGDFEMLPIAKLRALLAAHPVQVTTAEELDALPVVVADEWTDLARDHPVYRPRAVVSDRPEVTT